MISELLTCIHVLFFRKDLLILKIRLTGIKYYIRCEIKHFLQYSGRKVKDKTHTAGDTLEIPDMGYRSCKLDMTHSVTAHT